MLFGLGLGIRIYIAAEAIDMRKGFEGLHGLVRDQLGHDPLSRHLFLFTNKAKTRLKALVWDGSGLWVGAKRLEKGHFRWPEENGQSRVTMRFGRAGNAGERIGSEANATTQLVSQRGVRMCWNIFAGPRNTGLRCYGCCLRSPCAHCKAGT
jgi:transposase